MGLACQARRGGEGGGRGSSPCAAPLGDAPAFLSNRSHLDEKASLALDAWLAPSGSDRAVHDQGRTLAGDSMEPARVGRRDGAAPLLRPEAFALARRIDRLVFRVETEGRESVAG